MYCVFAWGQFCMLADILSALQCSEVWALLQTTGWPHVAHLHHLFPIAPQTTRTYKRLLRIGILMYKANLTLQKWYSICRYDPVVTSLMIASRFRLTRRSHKSQISLLWLPDWAPATALPTFSTSWSLGTELATQHWHHSCDWDHDAIKMIALW